MTAMDRTGSASREVALRRLAELQSDMNVWSRYTYGNALRMMENNGNYDPAVLDRVRDFLYDGSRMRYGRYIADRFMDGGSVAGLGARNDGRTDTVFDEIPRRMERTGFVRELVESPVHYLYAFLAEYLPKHPGARGETVNMEIVRSFNYYPSMLRERSLGYMLEFLLPTDSIGPPGGSGDRIFKTDICADVACADGVRRMFRIWSYLVTKRGMENTLQRFSGRRSNVSLRKGLHLLAPLNTGRGGPLYAGKTSFFAYAGWYLYSWEYTRHLAGMMKYPYPDNYKKVMSTGDGFVSDYLRFPHLVAV